MAGSPFCRAALLAVTLFATSAAGVDVPGSDASLRPPAPGNPSNVFGAFLAGRFAADELDTRTAADSLLSALRAEPDQPELLQRAFLAALLDGRPEALRLARRLPDNLASQLVLMGSDVMGGRFDRAESRARALPRQGAIQALQPVIIAWTLAGRGQWGEALALLRPQAESGRFRALNALHAALIADLGNRPRDAERYVRLALADQPEPTLRLSLLAASILHRTGKQAEAARLLDRLAEGHDELALAALEPARSHVLAARGITSPAEGIAEAYVALGAALRGQGLEEMSTLLARLALRIRPGFAPALLLLGDQFAEAEQFEAGLEILAAIPANDPLAPAVALRRAGLLDRLDRLAEAEQIIREVMEILPDPPQPRIRLGDILRRRSRFAEAAVAYDGAIERLGVPRGYDWPLFYARGIARERSGNWPGAEADFLYALELTPEQPYVLNYLGYSWADQGVNLDRARAMLERAVELRPQDGNIADSLGWVLFRLGDHSGAIQWLEKAVELEPRSGTINDHLGDAYWGVGREAEARFQWRRALTMDNEPDEAEKIELKLRDGLPRPARQD
ncbi:tetratricopeptide repeat protein [Sabulicella rubraurantiaca]|uniref:tetratricopeptide repeat protein n=1 Tax=Sabulicella rubraurantiaca TaxID=2811429 RepID=UPI001A96974A|nr:tetratricopeptide repeat protein [Sabulicella rubraurantiaca]